MSDSPPQAPQGDFVLFQAADGTTRIECRFESDTLWLTQAAMADLYQISPQAVTQHIKAVYREAELDQNATCKSYLQVGMEGSRQVSKADADTKAKVAYDKYAQKRRLLKEIEGQNQAIESLAKQLKNTKKKDE